MKNRFFYLVLLFLFSGSFLTLEAEVLSPLHQAAQKGDLTAVQKLLSEKVPADITDESGNTPLHYAAVQGSSEITSLLVSGGANPDARNNDKKTPLHYACLNGHLELVNFLISKNAEYDAKTKQKYTFTEFLLLGSKTTAEHKKTVGWP